MSKPTPILRSAYPNFKSMPVRLTDIDRYGHVNNAIYTSYFDTAVNSWYHDEEILDMNTSPQIFYVVETKCQFFKEIKFRDTVHVGWGVKHLGNTSVQFQFGIFVNDDDAPRAQGEYLHVQIERATKKTCPIEGIRRDFFERNRIHI